MAWRQAKDETIPWYNCDQLHTTLAYVSPMKFEKYWLAFLPRLANI